MKQLIFLLRLLITGYFVAAQDIPENVHVFVYFKNNGEDGIHLAYSDDGFSWTSLFNDSAIVAPKVGKDKLMRDPCIVKGPDGLFHMVWTVSWKERGFGYASSKDLIHWSKQQYIPSMENDSALNCWAPEINYDQKTGRYMIYWASTIPGKFPETDSSADGNNNHRIYYTLTKDFVAFTKRKILYNKGFNVIDASIVKDKKQYVLFLKDETKRPIAQKNIRIATSTSLVKGFSSPSPPITGNYWAEGPTALKMNGKWIVYFDKYRDHQYGAIESVDLIHWTDISDKIKIPAGLRHGTIFTISRKEFQNCCTRP